ncbi:Protein CBR-SRH-79 [Caenorhabditis briggsae]|uniref:Protein CBR-SRH-79 n=1 Tax=Caenorhabditis briggsae TaxID=6238 RepID=A8XZC6_CAEBR|nr:Protein CBR-SRH-79 [Caenorhabditis briggsae]CAP38053.2 Protein CBR-SRH-79 [Caenorhabditis briggsae]
MIRPTSVFVFLALGSLLTSTINGFWIPHPPVPAVPVGIVPRKPFPPLGSSPVRPPPCPPGYRPVRVPNKVQVPNNEVIKYIIAPNPLLKMTELLNTITCLPPLTTPATPTPPPPPPSTEKPVETTEINSANFNFMYFGIETMSIHDYYTTNYTKCQKCDNFLCTWQGLAFTSHSITVVVLPFHLLGGYCILFKTPVYMTFYRWPLFNLHFWSSLVDILLSVLITPYLIFPAVAGFPVGLLHFLNVPVPVQIWLGIMSIYVMIMSMTILLENRHNSIPSNRFRISRKCTKVLYYSFRIILAFFYSLAIFLFIPEDQKMAMMEILKDIPCPTSDFFKADELFVLCIDDDYITFLALITALGVLLEICQMLFFMFCCLYYLFLSIHGFTSKKTRKLQIAFFGSIILQVSIPVMFLIPSFVFMVFSVVTGYYNQALTNFAVLHASLHGFLSTIVVLIIHKPYRNFILSFFGKSKNLESLKKSTMWDTRRMSVFPTNVTN